MGDNLFIGVDIGTQSLRTGIFDEEGEPLSFNSKSYEFKTQSNNYYTQSPNDWWNAFKVTLNKCLNELENYRIENIKSLAFCATSSTVLPVDKKGVPLDDAILWMDQRAYKEAEKINATNYDVLKYSGGEVSPEWMVPKLLWYKNNQPSLYKQSDYIIEVLDWFNYKLTKIWSISKCNATCKWNYLDIIDGWSEDFMSEIGLEHYKDKWPDKVIPVGEQINNINKSVAIELGLPTNIKIIQGGIDAHIALLGIGVTDPKELGMIMGSSFVHLSFSNKPVFQEGIWGPYPNPILKNLWLLEGGQVSGASINRWYRDNFGKEYLEENENFYQEMSKEAASLNPGSDGLIVLDFWEGNRTPYKDPLASGTILGLRLKHTKTHIYRAILEGIAYGTRNVIEYMENKNKKIEEIVVCGGGSKDKLWLQIISDVTGKDIITTKFNEAGILGCAIIAQSGVTGNSIENTIEKMVYTKDKYKPNFENKNIYDFYFKKYKEAYKNLKNIMRDLSQKN